MSANKGMTERRSPVPSQDDPARRWNVLEGVHSVFARRWIRWFTRAILIVLILGVGTLAMAEITSPSVADAPRRVAAINRQHGTSPTPIDPAGKISLATISAEDKGFYNNNGIDPLGVLRAGWGVITGADLGGSTIEQQLAKVLYTPGATGITDRMEDVALALKIDGHYTKPAILTMYLNAIYYGHGYYGIHAASEGYFGVGPEQLTWAQASLLAGLPHAPSQLDPLRYLGAAKARQQYVLGRLVANGVLTSAQATAAAVAPLGLRGTS
jgi:membrane peptidoglycan carboxypeptidase